MSRCISSRFRLRAVSYGSSRALRWSRCWCGCSSSILVVGDVLTDRVVVITGGSRGIGRATAIAAAARGFRVCIGYASNEAAARQVVSTIEARNGKAIAVKCDVASENDILALFKAADAFGTLGALINNAGIVGPSA